MKKLILLTAITAYFIGAAVAQSKRMVLVEEFTGASCPPCASQNPAFNAFLDNNKDKAIAIKYQINIPGADPMYNENPTDVRTRFTRYNPSGVPSAILNGFTPVGGANDYTGFTGNITQARLDAEYDKVSPYSINLTYKLNDAGDSAYAKMIVKSISDVPVTGNRRAYIVFVEEKISYDKSAGSNGEKEFFNVMKKILPADTGVVMPSLMNKGDSVVFDVKWKLANIHNIATLAAVGFVQDRISSSKSANMFNYTTYEAAYCPPSLPFIMSVNGTDNYRNAAVVNTNTTKVVDFDFTTTSEGDTYKVKLTKGIPKTWAAKLIIDGVEYADSATFTGSKAASKVISIAVTTDGITDTKGTVGMTFNSAGNIRTYKVYSSLLAFTPVTTLVVQKDANSSATRLNSALTTTKNPYVQITDVEFAALQPDVLNKDMIKHIWFNAGGLINGNITENEINSLSTYLDNGGKLLMSSALFGFEAKESAAGTLQEAMLNFYNNYLKAGDYITPRDPNLDLDRRGDSVVVDPNDINFSIIQGGTSTGTAAIYGDFIPVGADSKPFLFWREGEEEVDPANVAGIYYENADKGSKVIYTSVQFATLKEAAYRSAFADRAIRWFDGIAASINDISVDNDAIKVYPNPTNQLTSILFEKALVGKADVKILNAIGQLVTVEEVAPGTAKYEINTTAMPAGLYTVRVTSNGTVATQKLNVVR